MTNAAVQDAEAVMSLRDQWAQYYRDITADKSYAQAAKDYQYEGAMFLAAAKRGILGDEMGLGKSLTSIMALDMMGAKRVIVIAQAEICEQFAGEVMQWAPHREVINLAKKTTKQRDELLDSLWDKDEWVVVVNFEMLRPNKSRKREPNVELQWLRADTVIIDEAHNVKNTTSTTYKAVSNLVFAMNICPRCGFQQMDAEQPCLSCGWTKGQPTAAIDGSTATPIDVFLQQCSVKNLILTTGTPILNEPGDLWPLLHLCNPVTFKKLSHFLNVYAQSNYFSGKWEFKSGGLDALAPLLASNFLARTKFEVGIQLPAQHVHVVPITMDEHKYPKQMNAITGLNDAAQILLDSGEALTVFDTMALITRKRQANVWPGGIVMKDKEGTVILDLSTEIQESIKMDRMMQNVLDAHARGERQVVFSQFKTGLAEFAARLEQHGLRVARLDGDTPASQRSAIKTNFDRYKAEEPRWDILLTHYRSGGTGLNLTAATVTHVLDEEWNPGRRDQAYARTNRIGQVSENTVWVYRLEHSVDTWMAQVLHRKEQLVKGFNDANGVVDSQTFKEALASGEFV